VSELHEYGDVLDKLPGEFDLPTKVIWVAGNEDKVIFRVFVFYGGSFEEVGLIEVPNEIALLYAEREPDNS
jgi:hypothetical protein